MKEHDCSTYTGKTVWEAYSCKNASAVVLSWLLRCGRYSCPRLVLKWGILGEAVSFSQGWHNLCIILKENVELAAWSRSCFFNLFHAVSVAQRSFPVYHSHSSCSLFHLENTESSRCCSWYQNAATFLLDFEMKFWFALPSSVQLPSPLCFYSTWGFSFCTVLLYWWWWLKKLEIRLVLYACGS